MSGLTSDLRSMCLQKDFEDDSADGVGSSFYGTKGEEYAEQSFKDEL